MAEENPRAEIYVGYAALAGFNGSAAFNLNRWVGIVGDFSYRIAEYYADKPLQTFTAGPKASMRLVRGLTPFVHALIGGARSGCGSFSDSSGCRPGTDFALILGGGVDIKIKKEVAIRAIQIDKIRTRFGGRDNTYTGVSFGIVARLGR